MAKTEVAETKKNEVAPVYDYGEFAREGFEDTKITDLSIPFILVLQSNSPQVEEQTVEGAKSGDLLNSVTNEIIKQPLIILPVEKEHAWVEWVPRTKGGGLAGRHEPTSEQVKNALKKNGGSNIPPKDPEGKRIPFKSDAGNDLVETFYVYCLTLNEEGNEVEGFCVLSFSSTKIKPYKDWWTSISMLKEAPPIFANRAKISTVKQTANNKTFFNYSIRPFGPTWRESLIVPDEAGMALLQEAKRFRAMIRDGLARADFDSIADSDEGSTDGGTKSDGPLPSDSEEIPF